MYTYVILCEVNLYCYGNVDYGWELHPSQEVMLQTQHFLGHILLLKCSSSYKSQRVRVLLCFLVGFHKKCTANQYLNGANGRRNKYSHMYPYGVIIARPLCVLYVSGNTEAKKHRRICMTLI